MSRKNTTWLKEIRKGLALFLSAAMVATALPQAAFAEETTVAAAAADSIAVDELTTEEVENGSGEAADLQTVSADTTDDSALEDTQGTSDEEQDADVLEDAESAEESEKAETDATDATETEETSDAEDDLTAECETTSEMVGGNRVYQSTDSDLIATVPAGEEGDVYYSYAGESGAGATVLFVNTTKDVTITMKEGVTTTTDVIASTAASDREPRHIILQDVVIDRSDEDVFYQWVYVAGNNLSGMQRILLSALATEDLNEGYLRLTLKGTNVLKAPGSSNAADSNSSYGYTPTIYEMLAGIRAGSLAIDGTGSLDVSGRDFGIHVKRRLDVEGGYLKITGGTGGRKTDIFAGRSYYRGGYFAKGDLTAGTVYDKYVYDGTLNNGKIRYCELVANTDDETSTTYPYEIRKTKKAKAFLDKMIARRTLFGMNEDYARAYDVALSCLDGYTGGGSITVEYGENYGFDMSQSLAIVHALQNDHPEYWWFWINKISPGLSGAEIVLENTYTSAVVRSKSAEFEAAVEEVYRSAAVSDLMTDVQKAYVLYQVLEAHVSYNLNYMDQSSNSAFTEGKAVCDGYAKAYMLLLQKAGISASYIEGWGTPGGGTGGMHGWVIVEFDDGWYFCDPTWDDGGSEPKWEWFLTNKSGIAKWHEAHWEDMGYEIETTDSDEITIPANIVKLTSANADGGKVYPASINLPKYSPAAITIVPDEGKSVDSITVGGSSVAVPEEDENGVVVYELASVSADTNVVVTFKAGSRSATKITGQSAVSFKVGDAGSINGNLSTIADAPIADATIAYQILSRTDAGFSPVNANVTTGGNGAFSISLSDLPVGSYQLTASFEGNASYRVSKAVFDITVLEDQQIIAGDFVLSRTGGGTLTEGQDYSYTEDTDENEGKGILTILSDAPVTIGMAPDVSSSNDRICVDTTDSNATADITLSSVVIDRSDVIFTGEKTEYDSSGGLAAGYTMNARFSSGLCTEGVDQYSQKYDLTLDGYSVIKGSVSGNEIDTGNPMEYYAGIFGGVITVKGSGGMSITAGRKMDNGYLYKPTVHGIDCQQLTVEEGDLDVSLDLTDLPNGYSEAAALYIYNKYEQKKGNVYANAYVSGVDGKGIFTNYGIYAQDFSVTGGSLVAENCKSSDGVSQTSYEYHSGIRAQMLSITGGSVTLKADKFGLDQWYNAGKATIGNTTLSIDLHDAAGTPLVFEGTPSIYSGLFGAGDVNAKTVYGKAIDDGSTIEEVNIGGKTWYRVKDGRALEVTGGEEGEDYTYEKGVYKLLTAKTMTFSMKPGKEFSTEQILSSAAKGVTHHIILNNVTIDRSSVEFEYDYQEDSAIEFENANLDLTLKGTNAIKGSVEHDKWSVTSTEYVCDNNGIYLIKGKLTVGGTGSLKVVEPWCAKDSAGINVGDYEQTGGTVEIVCGQENVGKKALFCAKTRGYSGTPAGNGTLKVSGGKLSATIAGGSNEAGLGAVSAICADGDVTVTAGEIVASTGTCAGQNIGIWANGDLIISGGSIKATSGTAADSEAGVNDSFGVKAIGNVTVTGGLLEATGGDSIKEDSIGLSCASDLTLEGGQIIARGGNSASGRYGYGLVVMNNYDLSKGTLKAYGPDQKAGLVDMGSVGIHQISTTGHASITGATVEAIGGNGEAESFGMWNKGHTHIIAGTLKATGGNSARSNSAGFHNDTDNVVEISGGTCEFTGGQAGNKSTGLFASAVSGGIDCQISGGTVTFKGGAGAESYGAYLYNKLVISGGKISASAAKKPIDCNTSSITGGSFAVGDTAANTVYGIKPAAGYAVAASGDAAYPYLVKSTGSSGGSGGSGGGGSSQTTVPVTGTKEKSGDGKATYEVTGTTESGGQTVAEVTYKAPEGSQKNASSVTIPANVTLEDGSKAVVTQVADSAFSGNKKITKVTIPATVEEIGSNAFAGCISLKTVNVKGSSLVNIKQGAFRNCKKLTAVTIGKNVKSIGKNAFAGDTKLKKVTFKTTKITKAKMGKNAFKNISKKAVIYYPKKLKGKNLTAFKKALKKAGVPKTVKYKKK
ncbi:MAG: leucine-rich repeat protein [Lachnospiraceae bacterium]|nr:leucine-rich repeat protein [Lachnospiraceae bacterium]